MIGLSRFNHKLQGPVVDNPTQQSPQARMLNKGLENNAQRINTLATGITAAGIAGTAVVAGAVANRVKTALSDDRLMKKTYPNVEYKAKSIVNRAIVKTADLASKITTSIKAQLTPSLTSLSEKVVPSLKAAKEKVLGNTVVQKLVATGAVAAAVVAEKGQSALRNVKSYVTNLPKPVKIAALAAAGILAVSHVYRSGQISGIFAAPKQESSGQ